MGTLETAHTRLEGEALVEAREVSRVFGTGPTRVEALGAVRLDVAAGEMVVLRGRSGAGKTTLLNILVGLDDPTAGTVTLLGQRLAGMNEERRAKLRREGVGMLFQNAHLFPTLTAQENVELALRLLRMPPEERRQRAASALERVGLAGRAHHRSLELSGGEQQRVALARALAHDPRLLVADEPTGALDTRAGRDIAALLHNLARERGIGLLVATHDMVVAAAADREMVMEDGAFTQR